MKMRNKLFAVSAAAVLMFGFAPDVLAKGGGGFGGGSRSFSSGGFGSSSRSFSSGGFGSSGRSSGGGWGFSAPSAPKYTTPTIPPRTYSTPAPAPAPRTYTAPATTPTIPKGDRGIGTAPAKPLFSGLDSGASKAMKQQESQKKFQAANKPPVTASPAPTYGANNSSAGSNRDLRRELRDVRMENRALRQDRYYGNYYNRPVPVYANYGYHDPFGNIWFWMWLMDRSNQNERDTWLYNHRHELDSARYEQLKREDADLEKRLAALEAKGVAKDPNYVPKGMDPDLVYSDVQVKEAQQPAVPVAALPVASVPAGSNESSGHPWLWLFGLLTVCGVVYLVFFKRWEV